MTGDGAPVLQIEKVGVDFGGLRALDEVSAEVFEGQTLGIIGPNGAGKTTLFNVVSGLIPSARGEITLDGTELQGLQPHQRARAGVGRTFQNLALYDEMSTFENVLMGRQRWIPETGLKMLTDLLTGRSRHREQRSREIVWQVLADLGLTDIASRAVSELPFGSRRLVDLGRALAGEPKVLLLDEPTSGLNVDEKPAMLETIARFKNDLGIGVIVVEHDMTVISSICDYVLVLNEGHLIASGSPAEVLADPVVRQAYLGPQLERRPRSRREGQA